MIFREKKRIAANRFFFTVCRAFRISFRRIFIIIFVKPIRRPFPDIAHHIVESVTFRRETLNGRTAQKSVFDRVFREIFLATNSQRLFRSDSDKKNEANADLKMICIRLFIIFHRHILFFCFFLSAILIADSAKSFII